MSRLQALHPDQQAVLQLVLRRRLSYSALADVLGLPAEQVRERALDAVDGLAPDDVPGLELEDRDRIGDLLLGQAGADAAAAEALLRDGDAARGWAARVAAELAPLGGPAVPVPPAAGPAPAAAPAGPDVEADAGGPDGAPALSDAPSPEGEATDDGPDEATAPRGASAVRRAFAALDRDGDGDRPPTLRGASPRTLGLGALAAVLVIALVLWISGAFDGGDDGDTRAAAPAATTATNATDAVAQQIVSGLPGQINFTPPSTAEGAYAKVAGVSQPQVVDGTPGLALQAQGFPAMTSKRQYAVWMDGGGQDPVLLGRFADGRDGSTATIDSSGRISALFIPFTAIDPRTNKASIVDARKFTRVRVTREGSATPKTPGATVLTGKLR
ncbi:hypothetical protein [Patulibacter sp. SYSU D01012]|uniref:hypothetical protein n=1 Tax=Patulibacter sp. SYSU D01012 TaxID=2817381 RepID=UPI001B30FBB4|nr:hypothetical protein [Patulibacter sp. SYSU D01012]